MTVTELREALEKLEAEGKGGVPVIWWDTYHSDLEPMDVDSVELKPAPDMSYLRLGFKTDSPEVVEIG